MVEGGGGTREGVGDGPPGPGGQAGQQGVERKVWANIASMNVSKRKKTNTLEIRLESDSGVSCSLNTEEIERLLRRLKINSSQFSAVQACPERKNVVYITFAPGVDLKKFVIQQSESYILKPGIRTTTIRPVGNRDIGVTVHGLHPDTRDEAVVQYLNAHGVVNQKEPVIYGVFPGAPGSTLLAGKLNGNRTYLMEVKKNIGSYHIIDGERVSIRYRGQVKTCNKCHCLETECSGKGLARDCTSAKVLLSEHMKKYWDMIEFKPANAKMNEVDLEESAETLQAITANDRSQPPPAPVTDIEPDDLARYSGVVVKGFAKEKAATDIIKELINFGLPEEYGEEDIDIKENHSFSTVYIHDLKPEICVTLLKNLHGKEVLGRRLSVFALVEETPTKKQENDKIATQSDNPNPAGPDSASSADKSVNPSKFWSNPGQTSGGSSDEEPDNSLGLDASYDYDESEFLKRKAKFSPSPATGDQFRTARNKKGRKNN